jgi:anti-sigma factor RsiW
MAFESKRAGGGAGEGGCGLFAARLEAYLAGDLDEGSEGEVRAHLRACGACRASAAALDPSSLFLGLGAAPLPASFWTGFRTRLRARLLQEPPSLWRLVRLPRSAYLVAPLAMLLVLVGSLFVLRPQRHRLFRPSGGDRPGREAPAMPAAGARVVPGGIASHGAPGIEEVGSPGARVYRFTVGTPGDETPIYLVVDEALDI